MTPVTSAGAPARPAGVSFTKSATASAGNASVNSVPATKPGATALTVTPSLANSRLSPRVRPCRAAFAAA